MSRLTKKGKDQNFISLELLEARDEGYYGKAAERLALFEDIVGELLQSQEQLSLQLQALRVGGRAKSVQFRELLGQKLVNARILSLFQAHDLL